MNHTLCVIFLKFMCGYKFEISKVRLSNHTISVNLNLLVSLIILFNHDKTAKIDFIYNW